MIWGGSALQGPAKSHTSHLSDSGFGHHVPGAEGTAAGLLSSLTGLAAVPILMMSGFGLIPAVLAAFVIITAVGVFALLLPKIFGDLRQLSQRWKRLDVALAGPDGDRSTDLRRELLDSATQAVSRLSEAVSRIKNLDTRMLAGRLVHSANEFVDHARIDPSGIVEQARFVTYYLDQALMLVGSQRVLAEHPVRNAEELARIREALTALVPVFEHYAGSMERHRTPSMDLELRLLRDSIRQDVPDAVANIPERLAK